jgi:hypothetical protein
MRKAIVIFFIVSTISCSVVGFNEQHVDVKSTGLIKIWIKEIFYDGVI